MSPFIHLQPINVVVYNDPQWKSNLEAGFALRCFQRLSSYMQADCRRSIAGDYYVISRWNPPQGAELAHLNMFRQACWLTKEILDADKPEDTPTVSVLPQRPKILTKEEAQSLLADYRKRYKAQLPSTRGTRPDPQAQIDKTTHAPKRYFRLDNFIRSMVYQSLKAQQTDQQQID